MKNNQYITVTLKLDAKQFLKDVEIVKDGLIGLNIGNVNIDEISRQICDRLKKNTRISSSLEGEIVE